MKAILFLDIDGVCHGEYGKKLSCLPMIEECVYQMPCVEVVISSAWRTRMTLEELRLLFSPGIRERVTGCTPEMEDGLRAGGRQKEIEQYLSQRVEPLESLRWVVLDDMDILFSDGYPHLIQTEPEGGFSRKDAERLLAWYRN